jgi:hypothetical protein
MRGVVLISLILFGVSTLEGQSNQNKRVEQPASAGNPVKLTVTASREQAASDSNFGITAEIENTSSATIYLRPEFITMLVPPELNASTNVTNFDWASFLPGPSAEPNDPIGTVIPLEAGSKTIAYWQRPKGLPSFPLFLSGLQFTPGKYTIEVVCTYWDSLDKAEAKDMGRFTQATSIQIPIIAPEDVILFGAAVGGVMAFVLLPGLWLPQDVPWNQKRRLKRVWIVIRGISVAAILSMMVTILLSRLSDTQFLVKVSVNDLWGAIAVGFVVGASGTSVLQKFTQANKGTSPNVVIANEEKKNELCEVGLEALADGILVDPFAAVQAAEDLVDHQFGLIALAVQQESVEDVIAAHGVFNLSFFVMLAQLGEVNDFVLAAEVGVAVDLEHNLLGIAGEWHSLDLRLPVVARAFRPASTPPVIINAASAGAENFLTWAKGDDQSDYLSGSSSSAGPNLGR